jgi:peptidoglycan/xylan/chitin deacetylase (PgdA/CDA1 family)
LPATIFLTTGFVDTPDTPWFCRLQDAMAKSPKTSVAWDGGVFDLSDSANRSRAVAQIKRRLKRLPAPKLLEENRRIIQTLGDEPDRPITADSPFRMLSREAIDTMAASGLIEFGSHTHSHAIVSRLGSKELREEIGQSIDVVRQLTGRPCALFAYPNGGIDDYDAESIEILQSFGVQGAVTGVAGPNTAKTPPLELRRYPVVATDDMAHFEIVVHHFASHVRRLMGGNRRVSYTAEPARAPSSKSH